MSTDATERRGWRHPVVTSGAVTALLVGLALLTYRPQVVGDALFPWDWLGRMTTGPSFVSAVISTGEWPVWVPFQGSGAPTAPDVGSGLYYPVHWLTGVLGVPLTADLQATLQVLHVALGGAGATALARARGVRWAWATVIGVGYLYFGGFSGQATHMHHVRGFALFPWLLWSATAPTHRGGRRLLLTPLLAWLVAAGAYPGQLPVVVVAAAAYGGVELWRARDEVRRQHVVVLALVGLGSAAAVAAVLWPYVSADLAGLLQRPVPPTAAARARESLALPDLLALVADRWTTHPGGGELRSWSVGVPVVVGLAGLQRADLRRHLPLLAAAGAGAAFMVLPRVPVLAGLVAAVHPSRFPFADGKMVVALVLVVLGVLGWSNVGAVEARRRIVAAVVVLGGVLLTSRVLVPTGMLTDVPWLLAAVLVACAALAVGAARAPAVVVVVGLGLLVAVDGLRVMADQDFEDRPAPVSPWEARPPAEALAVREAAVTALPALVTDPPPRRPARTPPFVSPLERASGHPRDALGYLGLSYNVTAYGGFVTEARWEAVLDPALAPLLELPWTAWVVPCDAACRASGRLPPTTAWQPTTDLVTTRYDLAGIDYRASFDEDVVVVENEIAYPGWQDDSDAVRPLPTDSPLRVWRVAAGDHAWTASFHPRSARPQAATAVLAVLLLLAAGLYAHRGGPRPGGRRR